MHMIAGYQIDTYNIDLCGSGYLESKLPELKLGVIKDVPINTEQRRATRDTSNIPHEPIEEIKLEIAARFAAKIEENLNTRFSEPEVITLMR